MALGPADNIIPPTHELPISDQGDHSHAWSRYNQDVADRLNGVRRGVTDGTDAKAGDIGEYATATGGSGSLTSNVSTNVAGLTLAAGDWDVWGIVRFAPSAGTHPLAFAAGVTDVPNSLGSEYATIAATFAFGTQCVLAAPVARFNLTASSFVYLTALSVFTNGGMNVAGTIKARRPR